MLPSFHNASSCNYIFILQTGFRMEPASANELKKGAGGAIWTLPAPAGYWIFMVSTIT